MGRGGSRYKKCRTCKRIMEGAQGRIEGMSIGRDGDGRDGSRHGKNGEEWMWAGADPCTKNENWQTHKDGRGGSRHDKNGEEWRWAGADLGTKNGEERRWQRRI